MSDELRSYHMTPDEFRAWGREMVDFVASYMERVEGLPVQSRVAPGEVRAALPAHAPETPERLESLVADLERVILPGLTHWQSPNFYAYFPSNTSGPSILADLLCAGLGVQGMLWSTAPACTEVETLVLDWLVDLLALPEGFRSTSSGGGVIQDSASSATLCALLAARERATDWGVNSRGVSPGLVVYASDQAHSSVEKAVRVAGLGSAALRLVASDATFALRVDDLAARVAADVAAGLTPAFVSATLGTTSSNAFDPLPAIAALCREHGMWLHVDAAMSGTAAVCPEFRHLQDGLELADSYCFNPHKWMFTGFDCDCFWVRDRSCLVRTLSVLPEYLRNQATASGKVVDYRDWQLPLGRRFRALKLWLVLRWYGAEGLRWHVRRHVALAHELAAWVETDPDFELVAPVPLNLVCFRHRGDDELNQRLLDRLNQSGALFLSHTRLAGRLVLRLCVGQSHTEERHVRAAWELIRREAAAVAGA